MFFFSILAGKLLSWSLWGFRTAGFENVSVCNDSLLADFYDDDFPVS